MACLVTAAISFVSGSVSPLSAVEAFRPLRSPPKASGQDDRRHLRRDGDHWTNASSDVLTMFSMFLSLLASSPTRGAGVAALPRNGSGTAKTRLSNAALFALHQTEKGSRCD
jgi:hypothetical protein